MAANQKDLHLFIRNLYKCGSHRDQGNKYLSRFPLTKLLAALQGHQKVQSCGYNKYREIKVYNTAKLDDMLNVCIHNVFKAESRDGKGHSYKILFVANLHLLKLSEK